MRSPELFRLTNRLIRKHYCTKHRDSALRTEFRIFIEAMFHRESPGILLNSLHFFTDTVRIDAIPAKVLAVFFRKKVEHPRHKLEDAERHFTVELFTADAIDMLFEAEGNGFFDMIYFFYLTVMKEAGCDIFCRAAEQLIIFGFDGLNVDMKAFGIRVFVDLGNYAPHSTELQPQDRPG